MTISGYLKLLYSMSLLHRFLNCFPAFQLDLWPTKLTENSICWGLLPSIQTWWAHSLWHQRSLKETDPHIKQLHSHWQGTMTRCHVKKNLLQLRAPCQWDLWIVFSRKKIATEGQEWKTSWWNFPFFDFFVGIHHSTDSSTFLFFGIFLLIHHKQSHILTHLQGGKAAFGSGTEKFPITPSKLKGSLTPWFARDVSN